jgi:subfamily B ATP-binding cassette protein MsbA
VSEGSISIDGVDLRDLSFKSLRRLTAVVSQETFLFNDTIRNNIAYMPGRESISLDAVIAAAKAANAHDFIMAMQEGYDTVVGERGVRLSGGQKQRLSIARALLKDSPILILDEATSSLDSESEYLVQEALNRLMKGRTTFVIAHRLSTVQHADRIIVLSKGRIVEDGRHDELLKVGGEYAKLYSRQFADNQQIVR